MSKAKSVPAPVQVTIPLVFTKQSAPFILHGDWIEAKMPDGRTVRLCHTAGLGGDVIYFRRDNDENEYWVAHMGEVFKQFVAERGWDRSNPQERPWPWCLGTGDQIQRKGGGGARWNQRGYCSTCGRTFVLTKTGKLPRHVPVPRKAAPREDEDDKQTRLYRVFRDTRTEGSL